MQTAVNLFLLCALVLPGVVVIFARKKYWINLLLSFACLFLIVVIMHGYWGYMDKPWFSPPEDFSCDGPCYGWFSFENSAPTIEVVSVGVISIVIGSFVKVTSFSAKKLRHKIK
jgi:hypothetical protein